MSVLGLLVGPALVALGRGRRMGASAVDGFALGVVPALLLLRLVPHVVEGAGAWGVALVCAGFGVLWLADRGHDHAHPADDARTAMTLGARLVVPALVLHALSDGAALAMATVGGHSHGHGAEHGVGESLAGAVLLHRLPEGLFLTMTFSAAGGVARHVASPRRRGRGHRRGRRARAGAVAGSARRLL